MQMRHFHPVVMSLETKSQSSAGVGEIGSVSLGNAIEDEEDRKDG